MANQYDNRRRKRSKARFRRVIIVEVLVVLILLGGFFLFRTLGQRTNQDNRPGIHDQDKDGQNQDKDNKQGENKEPKLTEAEKKAQEEQERLKKEIAEREQLIEDAGRLILGYDYDGAIEMIKGYQGGEGGYSVYPALVDEIQRIEKVKESLLLYGGSYQSVREFNHVFFHSLIAVNSKAFDGDYDSKGYNQFMTTTYEFIKMMEKMYEDGYVLVSIHDIVAPITQSDGTVKMVEQEIYLPEGKKPFVLSQDDVNYYDFMIENERGGYGGDGFARRLVIGEDGKVTCEMEDNDGSLIYGDFDMVPILDKFIEEHPDFSYRGAKGILAITGYEGTLGYRTNEFDSPTFAQDVEEAKKVAQALKDSGWEFACHGWGHRDAFKITTSHFITDTQRWIDEVGYILGDVDIYIFPYGADFETTMGHYKSEKYLFAKEKGFNYFCGVDKAPWMHIKDEYCRMTRRPLDGMAMLQYPERLADLFKIEDVIDPERPARDW